MVPPRSYLSAARSCAHEQVLKLLSESSGNILDDEGLINTLAQSKVTSNEIEIKAKEAASPEDLLQIDPDLHPLVPLNLADPTKAGGSVTCASPS